jgi:hypothetical protein
MHCHRLQSTAQIMSVAKELAGVVAGASDRRHRKSSLKLLKKSPLYYIIDGYERAITRGRPFTYVDLLSNINSMLYVRQMLVMKLESALGRDPTNLDEISCEVIGYDIAELLERLHYI